MKRNRARTAQRLPFKGWFEGWFRLGFGLVFGVGFRFGLRDAGFWNRDSGLGRPGLWPSFAMRESGFARGSHSPPDSPDEKWVNTLARTPKIRGGLILTYSGEGGGSGFLWASKDLRTTCALVTPAQKTILVRNAHGVQP